MNAPDGKARCRWANPKNPAYIHYHDHEWGVPVHDDARLFEMLLLETFQAGLSWECVLNKREAFRAAFANFDAEKVSAFGQKEIQTLLANPRIIRNRLKIGAAIANAGIFLAIRKEWNAFGNYLWHWTDNAIIHEQGLTSSPLSDAVSADLRQRGMKFTGSVSVYAYLQAVGVIYSHDPGCFLERKKA